MRRSRWDQKPSDIDNSTQNWRIDWNDNSSPSQSISSGDTRHFPHSPAPLDYSSESRARAQNFLNGNPMKKDCNKPESFSGSRSSSHLDNSWNLMQNPSYYPELGQGSQVSYPSHSGWNHPSQNFYSDTMNHNIFDYKWWTQQRDSMGSYFDTDDRYNKKDKNVSHPSTQWSFGLRVPRDNDRFSASMRNGDNIGPHFSRSFRDQRTLTHNGNPLSKHNKYDRFRHEGRQRSLSVGHFSKEYPNRFQGNKFHNNFYPHGGQSFSQRQSKSKVKATRSRGKSSKAKSSKPLGKKIKKKSAIENAKSKALAVAADKLKKTFLAAKKTKKKGGNKKERIANKLDNCIETEQEANNAQDLTLPRSIPRDGTSLEYDIDIQFSAREWELVGRGEGGTRNIPEASVQSSIPEAERDSDSDSVQTIDDGESESENSDSSTDVEEIPDWNVKSSVSSTRRRHASENSSFRPREKVTYDELPNLKSKRIRSYSTSHVDDSNSPVSHAKKLGSNLKNILLKELLTMDKKSLQELVNDPKSRKARLMMGHLMSMHKAALSQKLTQLRFKSLPSSSSSDDDIQFWQSITHAQLESLPTDVLDQVREILTLEQSGKDEQGLDEVSLSLSDILNGFNTDEPTAAESASVADANLELEQLSLQENSPDSECQIVTPPPKRPATTITIPDSDSELLLDSEFGQPKEISSNLSSQDVTNNESKTRMTEDQAEKPLDSPHTASSPDPPKNPSDIHADSVSESPSKSLPDFETSESNFVFPSPAPSISNKNSLASSSRVKSHPSPVPKLGNVPLLDHPPRSCSEGSSQQDTCELNIPTPSVKVKQERPSPISECGFCMHASRSPHTPHCSFSFGIPPSPVQLMNGPPRPLGHSHQRPIPHLPTELNLFKHEKQQAPFVSLDVNRPSSEERPKNPAPPDTNNSEPPSPLPIIPPQTTLHQHPTLHQQQPPPPPRSLLFSPQADFSEPPRPPPPPPPHSPRIKFERHTPQFVCCCMKNECDRTNSRQNIDLIRGDSRRNSMTPQNQLCEVAQRITPQLFKMEQHFLSTRTRTPHHNIMNMFHLPPPPRCIPPNSLPISNINSQLESTSEVHKASNVAVQTESFPDREKRPLPSKLKLSQPISSLLKRTDKATSTDGLTQSASLMPNKPHCSKLSQKQQEHPNQCSLDGTLDHELQSVNQTDNNEESLLCHSSLIGSQEKEIFSCIDNIDRKIASLTCEREKLFDALKTLHLLRSEKFRSPNFATKNSPLTPNICNILGIPNKAINTEENAPVFSNAANDKLDDIKELTSFSSLPENQSIVSSTQEIISERESSVLRNNIDSSNDAHAERERCTSTSNVECEDLHKAKNSINSYGENVLTLFSNTESDTDGDVAPSRDYFTKKNINHFTDKFDSRSRRRTESLSTSEDETTKDKDDCNSRRFKESIGKNLEKPFEENSQNDLNKVQENELNEFGLTICKDRSGINEEEPVASAPITCRKPSLSLSPLSPKTRYSSGSEHGYSLRSRGPPSESFDNEGQFLKDTNMIENQIDLLEDIPPSLSSKVPKGSIDEDQADDEFDKDDSILEISHTSSDSKICSEEKHRRKRKSKKQKGRRKRKKESLGDSFDEISPEKESEIIDAQSETDTDAPVPDTFIVPPPHKDSVLQLMVIGRYILSASADGTARLYDPCTGLVLASYIDHLDNVTSIQVIGSPNFDSDADSSFKVVTGCEDRSLRIFNGKTGLLSQKKNVGEPIRCLEYRWEFLFIGTSGGCGIKWNLKDKKLGEKIQFCGKEINCLVPHVEGGRKVLVVAAKTTPIMIRDAISGLFLRTLEYVQLNVYSALFVGNNLYTAGSEKNITIYDFCTGQVKNKIEVPSSISQLIIWKSYLFAICYDGFARIFELSGGPLLHALPIGSSQKVICSSVVYKNKILVGNKQGEIVCCGISDFKSPENS